MASSNNLDALSQDGELPSDTQGAGSMTARNVFNRLTPDEPGTGA